MEDEDIAFLKRFLLASGSLKELAQGYSVSYPTVRLRLDRLIEKIRIYDDITVESDFEKRLRGYFAEGKIDGFMLKSLLQAHKEDMENQNE